MQSVNPGLPLSKPRLREPHLNNYFETQTTDAMLEKIFGLSICTEFARSARNFSYFFFHFLHELYGYRSAGALVALRLALRPFSERRSG